MAVLRACQRATCARCPSASVGRPAAATKSGRQQRRHPLLATADAQPPTVLLLGPLHGQAELPERLVERRQVAVSLGVGEDAVAIEDERASPRSPASPGLARRCRTSSMWSVARRMTSCAHVAQQAGRVVVAGMRRDPVAVGVDVAHLERGRDVDLGAAARDEVAELVRVSGRCPRGARWAGAPGRRWPTRAPRPAAAPSDTCRGRCRWPARSSRCP